MELHTGEEDKLQRAEGSSTGLLSDAKHALCEPRKEEILQNMRVRCDTILNKIRSSASTTTGKLSIDSSKNSAFDDPSSDNASSTAKGQWEEKSSDVNLFERVRSFNERFSRIMELLHLDQPTPDNLRDSSAVVAASVQEVLPELQSDTSIEEEAITDLTNHALDNSEAREKDTIPCEDNMKTNLPCESADKLCASGEQQLEAKGVSSLVTESKSLRETSLASTPSEVDEEADRILAKEVVLEVYSRVYQRKRSADFPEEGGGCINRVPDSNYKGEPPSQPSSNATTWMAQKQFEELSEAESHASESAYLTAASFMEESVTKRTPPPEHEVLDQQPCKEVAKGSLSAVENMDLAESKNEQDIIAKVVGPDSVKACGESICSEQEKGDGVVATDLINETQFVQDKRGGNEERDDKPANNQTSKRSDNAGAKKQSWSGGERDDVECPEACSVDSTKEPEVRKHAHPSQEADTAITDKRPIEKEGKNEDDDVQTATAIVLEVYARVRLRRQSQSQSGVINAMDSMEMPRGVPGILMEQTSFKQEEESFKQQAREIIEVVYNRVGCKVAAEGVCAASSTNTSSLAMGRKVNHAPQSTKPKTAEADEPSDPKKLVQSSQRGNKGKKAARKRLVKSSPVDKTADHLSSPGPSSYDTVTGKSACHTIVDRWNVIDDAEKLAPYKEVVVLSDAKTLNGEDIVVFDPSKIPSLREFTGKKEYNAVMGDLLLLIERFIEVNVKSEKFVVSVHSPEERRSRLRSRKWMTEFYKLWRNRYSDRLSRCVLLKPSFKLKAFAKLSLPFVPNHLKERIFIASSRREFAKAQGLQVECRDK